MIETDIFRRRSPRNDIKDLQWISPVTNALRDKGGCAIALDIGAPRTPLKQALARRYSEDFTLNYCATNLVQGQAKTSALKVINKIKVRNEAAQNLGERLLVMVNGLVYSSNSSQGTPGAYDYLLEAGQDPSGETPLVVAIGNRAINNPIVNRFANQLPEHLTLSKQGDFRKANTSEWPQRGRHLVAQAPLGPVDSGLFEPWHDNYVRLPA